MVEAGRRAAGPRGWHPRGFFWLTMVGIAGVCAASTEAAPLCAGPEKPHFVVSTAAGAITIELEPRAAPRTIRELVRLAASGYYDGLTFDYANPHVEIFTSLREGDETRFEQEIDAGALGLDRDVLEDVGAAMNVLQAEILENHQAGRPETPRMREWLDRWYATREADFLVGVSRQQVYEALGYVYESGLASRPVRRGAVLLKPLSPRLASARLGLVLTDIPERTGKWMVIGQVVAGLETVEAISTRPRQRANEPDETFTPVEPVVIDALVFSCQGTTSKPRGDKK